MIIIIIIVIIITTITSLLKIQFLRPSVSKRWFVIANKKLPFRMAVNRIIEANYENPFHLNP
jgi:hypothetical protein